MSSGDSVYRPPSAVERVAQHLRDLALKLPAGEYLGSEQSLSRKHHITGPTLRQAIRLLQHEGMIEVRRGVRGGYYVGRPKIEAVTRAAATYLHGSVKSYGEILEFIDFLVPSLVDCVMANPRLEELREYEQPIHDRTQDAFVKHQTDFLKLFMDLVDNVSLHFVTTIFYQTVASLPLPLAEEVDQDTILMENLRADLASALVRRDRVGAIAAYLKANEFVGGVIKNHLGESP